MTGNEARERAEKIWGAERLISVSLDRSTDNWYVNLHPFGRASDVRGRTYAAHQLDANGHAICHTDCAHLEVNAR